MNRCARHAMLRVSAYMDLQMQRPGQLLDLCRGCAGVACSPQAQHEHVTSSHDIRHLSHTAASYAQAAEQLHRLADRADMQQPFQAGPLSGLASEIRVWASPAIRPHLRQPHAHQLQQVDTMPSRFLPTQQALAPPVPTQPLQPSPAAPARGVEVSSQQPAAVSVHQPFVGASPHPSQPPSQQDDLSQLPTPTVDARFAQYQQEWQHSDPQALQSLGDVTTVQQLFMQQLRHEIRAVSAGRQRNQKNVRSASKAGVGLRLSRSRLLLQTWTQKLALKLTEVLGKGSSALAQGRPLGSAAEDDLLFTAVAALQAQPSAEVTTTVFLQRLLLTLGGSSRVSTVTMCYAIAMALEDSIRLRALRDQLDGSQSLKTGNGRLQQLISALEKQLKECKVAGSDVARLLQARRAAEALRQDTGWSKEQQLMVGSKMLSLLQDIATVPVGDNSTDRVPAVEQRTVTRDKAQAYQQRVLSPSPALVEYLSKVREGVDSSILLDTRYQPMLVPPRPWTSLLKGGLLCVDHPAVRGYNDVHDAEWLGAAECQGQFDRLFRVLDILGSTPWRINKRVLEVAAKAAKAPDYYGTLGIPTHDRHPLPDVDTPSPYLRMSREGRSGGQLLITAGHLLPAESSRLATEVHRVKMTNANNLSLENELKLRLQVAEQLAQQRCFYQPHSVDFRGRAYPISGYLTHIGDDMSRGLLEFGEGRPLGKTGLRWLYIQIANCYGRGKDKLNLEDRYQFGMSCLDKCRATAKDPLSDQGAWWQGGDDPWQLLATALEVAAAVGSPDPEAHVSHLPVHQDGSCNGLQHYSALARDQGGGTAVNLVPAAKPQDVYQAVATIVDEEVRQQAGEGVSEAMKLMQRNGGVDRKLIKQTVMTTVYGVTFIGARDQIANRLVEKGWSNPSEVQQVSKYLATLTLQSVGKVFANAEPVKKWLANSASAVCKTGNPVRWTSPIGFPVQQPYFRGYAEKDKGEGAKEEEEGSQYPHNQDQSKGRVVDGRAQRTAFPPNYIHSLDAAHMMMTAEACKRQGVVFAGVHDSFFTHAGTVDILSSILRQEFVNLHKKHEKPLLEQLEDQLASAGPGAKLPPLPPAGSLDVECVLQSLYFFS